MNNCTNILRECKAHIHAIVSADARDTLAVQAIRERIRRIYNGSRNAFQIEQINNLSVQGTAFIKDHILSDVTEKTLIFFKNLEPSIYIFMLTKAVYLFALGSSSRDQIPGFFKPATKERIENQRREFNNQDKEHIASKLQEIMKDFSEFENAEGKVLACLKGIAHEEYNGLLSIKCLTDALSDSKYQDI